jgi:hypothetical protein
MTLAHSNVAAPTGAAGAIGLATVTWVANLELVLRISASALTVAVAIFSLYHYYNIYIRKKS